MWIALPYAAYSILNLARVLILVIGALQLRPNFIKMWLVLSVISLMGTNLIYVNTFIRHWYTDIFWIFMSLDTIIYSKFLQKPNF